MCLEELCAHREHGGRKLLSRPRVPLVHQDLAPDLDKLAGIGLRHSGSGNLLLPECVDDLVVVLWQDTDIATTLQIGREAVLIESETQGDVLGVAELGRAHRLAPQVGCTPDRRVDHQ